MEKDKAWDELSKRLSASMVTKTEELIDKKTRMDNTLRVVLLLLVLLAIGFIHIITNARYYMYAIEYNVKIAGFNIFVFSITFISMFLIYLLCNRLSKLKKDYEKLAQNIIKAFEKDFCKCDSKCSCMDDYVKYLYGRKIKVFHI